jgi:flavorubredoxin
MMGIKEIRPDVYSVGAIDWDRTIFDELIPLPEGTSYNSYLIKGKEKIALIDTVDPEKTETLMKHLDEVNPERIDYVIANHAEQDHSGSIPAILERYPEAKVVTNAKCKTFLLDMLPLEDEDFIVINDGDELSLGSKTLRFIFTPWVHWPETMSTYLVEEKILFTCDFFGSHVATSDLYAKGNYDVYSGAKRYYAEIMMPFRVAVRNNLKKVESLDIEIIAPSHGPMYKDPKFIIDAYMEWTSDDVANEVIIAFVSMHGSTKKAAEHLADSLMEKGISVKVFNLTTADIGELAMALVDAATLVIATPMVLSSAHPMAVYVAHLVNALRPKLKHIGIMTSYSWGGLAVQQLQGCLSSIKPEIIEPLMIKGHPDDEDLMKIEGLADEILKKHEALKITEK